MKGIRLEFIVPKTPKLSGLAERMNQTIIERFRSMLAHANLSKMFWAKVLMTVSRKSSRVREMKRNHQGPGPEGLNVCSSVSEKVLKIDRWMKREIEIEIEHLTLVLRDEIHHH